MTEPALLPRKRSLRERFDHVRLFSERLAEPLSPEDSVVQSMPDASPAKWHLAHTTWFFEKFVLVPFAPGYRAYRDGWDYLWNSYYEAVGPRHPRPKRGLLTRPTLGEVTAYRRAVDDAIRALLDSRSASPEALDVLELGTHHEEQHEELLLTDIQHAFSENPLRPEYLPKTPSRGIDGQPNAAAHEPRTFVAHGGGIVTIGHEGPGFAFDNEMPPHRVLLEPFGIASRLVTSREYMEFMADGGYTRPELWLSDGWDAVRAGGWGAPLYWEKRGDSWWRFSLHGTIPVDPEAPVCHVSYYEADAFARWAGDRLPTESEWEVVARAGDDAGQFVGSSLVPLRESERRGFLGGAWVWTASPYVPYAGFRAAKSALGEYNGKFMVNQMVLRGGSCLSPPGHVRPTYRNFFAPAARWQVTGIRLAR